MDGSIGMRLARLRGWDGSMCRVSDFSIFPEGTQLGVEATEIRAILPGGIKTGLSEMGG